MKKSTKRIIKISILSILCLTLAFTAIVLPIAYSKDAEGEIDTGKALQTFALRDYSLQADYVPLQVAEQGSYQSVAVVYTGSSEKQPASTSQIHADKYGYNDLAAMQNGDKYTAVYESMYNAMRDFYNGTTACTYNKIKKCAYLSVSISLTDLPSANRADAAAMILQTVLRDYPEFYFVDIPEQSKHFSGNSIYIYVDEKYGNKNDKNYVAPATVKAELEAKVKSYTDLINDEMSDYVKVQTIHDALIADMNYPEDYDSDKNWNVDYQGVTGALLGNRTAVCEGYSEAFKMIMDKIGIECLIVVGDSYDSEVIAHEWNLIKLNGAWYNLDVTWDDPIGGDPTHQYFCVPDSVLFNQSHVPSSNKEIGPNYLYALPEVATEEHPESALNYLYTIGTQIDEYGVPGVAGATFTDAEYVVVGPREVAVRSIKDLGEKVTVPSCIAVKADADAKISGDIVYAVVGVQDNCVANSIKDENDKLDALTTVDFSYAKYLTDIGEAAFAGCTALETVKFSTALHTNFEKIGDRAFAGCSGLAIDAVKWPTTTAAIGSEVFDSCLISDDGRLDLSGLPLKAIGANAFANTGLKQISLPKTLTDITGAAFSKNNELASISIAEGGRYYVDSLGVLYADGGKTLVAVPRAKELTFFNVMPSVTKVGEYAFYGSNNLKSITLADSVLSIGKYAFADAQKLSKVNIPEGIQTIEEGTFKNCGALKNLVIPASVETIKAYAFSVQPAGTAVTAENLKIVDFLGAAPGTVAGTAFDGCTLLHMNYDEKDSWGANYSISDATWKGFHALYLFCEAETVQRIVNSDLDTSMVKGTMEYKDGIWKSLNSNEAIARVTSDDATKATVFRLSVKAEIYGGLGGIIFYADDNMSSYYRYTLSDGGKLELRYISGEKDELIASSELFAPNRLVETVLEAVVDEDGNIQCYVNDELYITRELNAESRIGNKLGYALYSKGSVRFSNLTSGTMGTKALTYRSGSADYDEVDDFVENTDAALSFIHGGVILVNNHEYDGTSNFRARFNLFGAGGIVFAYRDNEGVPSYYRAGMDADGKLKIQYVEGPAASDLATSVNSYNINEEIALVFERVEDKVSISILSLADESIVETVSYTETNDRLKATEYGLYGDDNSEFSLFDLRFKNDYSKLDDNHFNRQGVYFDIDEENKTAFVGRKDSEEDGNSGYTDKNYGSVIIPESVRIGDVFYRVIGVADYAFANNKNLRSIVLPEGIQTVGTHAFFGCENLKLATFKGDAPATVGKEIFTGCHSFFRIETTGKNWGISYTNPMWNGFVCINPDDLYYMNYVILNENMTDMQNLVYIFGDAEKEADYVILNEGQNYNGANDGIVYIPAAVVYAGKLYRVQEIASYAFSGSSIRGVHFADKTEGFSIKKIGMGAFQNCLQLQSVNLSVSGVSITNILVDTFKGCTALCSVTLNKEVTDISKNAFNGCSALVGVNGLEKVCGIGAYAFSDCVALESIVLSDEASLNKYSFANCSGLKSVTFKVSGSEAQGYNGIRKIPEYAFVNTDALETVTLPRTLTEICEGAFSGSGLKTVKFEEGINLSNIRKDAFRLCVSLETLTVPQSVAKIEESAFLGCAALTKVNFEGDRPDFGQNVFALYDKDNDAVLPNGQIILYYGNDADGWAYPFVGDIAHDEDLRNATQYYFAMFNDNPYEGINGVELKHIELAYGSELWRTNDGAYRFISGSGSHIAVVKNHKISDNSLLVFEATAAGKDFGSTESYGLLFGFRQNENEETGDLIYSIPYDNTLGEYAYTGYFFGIDPTSGKVALIRYNNGKGTELASVEQTIPGYSKDIAYTLSIRYYGETGVIEGYINGVKMFENVTDAKNLKNAYCAFKASGSNMEFSNASIIELGNVLDYQASRGEMKSNTKNGYESLTKVPAYATVVNEEFLYDGMTTFNFKTSIWYKGELKPNGIVFAMGEDGSYYLLVAEQTKEGNALTLYEKLPEEAELTKLHSQRMPDAFQPEQAYELKIAWNASDNIDCYVDGAWVFTYKLQDSEMLSGFDYGLYAESTDVRFSNTVVTVNNKPDTAKLDEYSDLFDSNRNLQGILFELDKENNTATVLGGYRDGLTAYDYQDESGMVFLPSIVKDTEGNLYTVVAIAPRAFENCDDLIEIEIPNSVLTIGEYAFNNTCNLKSVRLPNALTAIEEGTFYNANSLTAISLPNTMVSIGKWAFNGCKMLTSFNIPASVESIGEEAFAHCSDLVFFTVADDSNFAVRDGVLYTKEFTELVSYPLGRKESSLTVPSTVTKIWPFACIGASNLKSVTLPAGLTEIGEYAFADSGLTSITIPSGVKEIPEGAFNNCHDLASAILKEGVCAIGEKAFGYCEKLEAVELPNGLISIGTEAFAESALTSVVLPQTLEEIGEDAFADSDLTSVEIPDSVTTVGLGAFGSCPDLTHITIGAGLTSLDGFRGDMMNFAEDYPNLKSITVSAENKDFASDGIGVLYSADGKTLYCIPLVTSVDAYAVKSGVETIADGAIGAFEHLETLYLPASVTDCGATADFRGIVVCHNDLTTVLYERQVNLLPVVAFESMTLTGIHHAGPTRFDFTVGNEPSYSGLIVFADYSYQEGTITRTVSLPLDREDYTVSPVNSAEAGEKTVVLDYQGKSDSFLINYADKSPISLKLTKPEKLTYVVNDKFTAKGLVVSLIYDVGRAETLKAGEYDISITEGTKLSAGEQTVTVSYTTKHNTKLTASFDILVYDRTVVNTLVSNPYKTTYEWGEAFDSAGISFLLIYNTGETKDLILSKDFKLMLEDGNELVDGYLMKVDVTGQIRAKIELLEIELPENVVPNEIILEVEPLVLTQPEPVVLLSQTENKLVVRLPDSFNSDIYHYVFEINKNGTWEESRDGSFDGLTSGTSYPIRVRIIREDCIDFIDTEDESFKEELFCGKIVNCTTLKKLQPKTPIAPYVVEEVDTKSSSRISLTVGINAANDTANAGAQFKYQFSTDGNNWKDADANNRYTFTGLNGLTNYTIYARYAANTEYEAGERSEVLNYKTGRYTATASQPSAFVIKTDSIELANLGSDYEYARVEYEIVEGEVVCLTFEYTWQKERIFGGLQPNTTYAFVAHRIQTDTNAIFDTEPSSPILLKTGLVAYEKPTIPEEFDFEISLGGWSNDKTDVIFAAFDEDSLYEYHLYSIHHETVIGEGEEEIDSIEYIAIGDWTDEVYFEGLSPMTEYAIFIRRIADENGLVSESTLYTEFKTGKSIQSNLTAPVLVDKTETSVELKNDYVTSSGTKAYLEFAIYAEGEWKWQESPLFEGLDSNTEYRFAQRLMADDLHEIFEENSANPYEALTVTTVREKTDFTDGLDLSQIYLVGDGTYGTTVSVVYPYAIEVDFKWTIDGVEDFEASGTDFKVVKQALAGGAKTVRLTITPKNTSLYIGEIIREFTPKKATRSVEQKYIATGSLKNTRNDGNGNLVIDYTVIINTTVAGTVDGYKLELLVQFDGSDEWLDFGSEGRRTVENLSEGDTFKYRIRYKGNDLFEESDPSDYIEKSVKVSAYRYLTASSTKNGVFAYGESLYTDVKYVKYGVDEFYEDVDYTVENSIYEYYRIAYSKEWEDGTTDDGEYWICVGSPLWKSVGTAFSISEALDYYDETDPKWETENTELSYICDISTTKDGKTVKGTATYKYYRNGYVLRISAVTEYGSYILSTDHIDRIGLETPTETIAIESTDETMRYNSFSIESLDMPIFVMDGFMKKDCQFLVEKDGSNYIIRVTKDGFEISTNYGTTWAPGGKNVPVTVNGEDAEIALVNGRAMYKTDEMTTWEIASEFTFSIGNTSYTVEQTFNKAYYLCVLSENGQVNLANLKTENFSTATTFTDLQPGKSYAVVAYYPGMNDACDSSAAAVVATYTVPKIPLQFSANDEAAIAAYLKELIPTTSTTIGKNNTFNAIKWMEELPALDIFANAANVTLPDSLQIQFSRNGVTWENSLLLSGLIPQTEYRIYMRIAGTDSTEETNTISALIKTAKQEMTSVPAKPATVAGTVKANAFGIKQARYVEYSLDRENWVSMETAGDTLFFENLEPNTEYTVYARYKETDTYQASGESEALTVMTTRLERGSMVPNLENLDSLATLKDTSISFSKNFTDENEHESVLEFWVIDHSTKWGTGVSGLEPNTTYKVKVRFAEDELYFTGTEEIELDVTTLHHTPKTPTFSPSPRVVTESSVTLIAIPYDENNQYSYEYYCMLGNGNGSLTFDEEKWQSDPIFNDLQKDQQYTFYCRVAADDRNFAGKPGPGKTVVTTPMSISGSISIGYKTDVVHAQGLTYGALLLVNLDDLKSKPEAPTYQWYRNGVAISGETRSQYEVKEEDIGQTIMVHLKGDSLCPGDVKASVVITKRVQTAPAKPNLKVEGTTIAVQVVAGCEYSLNGGDPWNTFTAEADGSYRLTGYTPDTEVTVYVRRSETDTDAASEAVSATVKATKNTAKAVSLQITSSNSTIEFQMYAGCYYTISGTNFDLWEHTATKDEVYKHEFTAGGSYVITAKRLETADTFASDTVSLTVKLALGSQEAPTGELQMKERTDTSITLVAIPGCEYSIDQITWYTGAKFTNLEPNTEYTFYYRYKETAYRKASDIGPTATFTTDKAKQNAPASPSLQTKTARTIKVGFEKSFEFCIVPASEYNPTAELTGWIGFGDEGEAFKLESSSLTFLNLEPESEYYLFKRAKGTDTAYPSEASKSLRVVTYAEYEIIFNISYLDNENEETLVKLDGISRAYYKGETIDIDSIKSMLPDGEDALRYTYSIGEGDLDKFPKNAYTAGEYTLGLVCTEKLYNVSFVGAHEENLVAFSGGYKSQFDLSKVPTAPEYHPVEGDENFVFTFRAYSDENGKEYLPSEISNVILGDANYTAVYDKTRMKYDVDYLYIDANGNQQTERKNYDAGSSITEILKEIGSPDDYMTKEGEYKFSDFVITDSMENIVGKQGILEDNLTIVAEYDMQAHRHVVYDTDNKEKGYKPVTCTVDGLRGAKCNDCGFVWEEVITHKGHDYKWVAEVSESCTENGTEAHYECKVCHMTFDSTKQEWNELTIPMLNHKNKVHGAGFAATCTKEGEKEHWYCPDCEKNFADEKCSTELASLTIAKENHTWATDWIPEIPAQCEIEGTKGHRYCTACKTDYDANENAIDSLVIPALQHNYGEWIEKTPATVDEEGEYAHYHCDRCRCNFDADKKQMTNIVIPKCGIISVSTEDSGRGETVTVILSMSQNPGISSMKIYVNYDDSVLLLADNKKISNGDIIDSLTKGEITQNPFNLVWSGANDSFENGELVSIKFTVKDTARFGASTISVTVVDTCNQSFEYLDMVANSGTVYIHNFGAENWVPENPASCTANGTVGHYHCSVCGRDFDAEKKAIEDLTITAPGHNYGTWIAEVPAQCEIDGTLGHYECSECHVCFDAGKNEITNLTITAPGHNYGTWIAEVPAQCEIDGTLGHYKCSECHLYFDEEHEEMTDLTITAPGHNYGTWIELEDSSCTEFGTLGHYHCVACGTDFDVEHSVLSDLTIAKKNHTYDAWTKDNDTNHKKVCVCGDTVYEAHKWDDGEVTVPTYYHEGKTVYTCSTCAGKMTVTTDCLVQDENSPVIGIDDAYIGIGRTAVLTLSVRNNPGFKSITFNLICPTGFSVEKVEDADGNEIAYTSGNPITYTADETLTDDTVILNVTVKADSEMNTGNVTVGMELVGAYDADGAEIALCVGECTVEVFRFGDLNGDGDIDVVDATLMMQQIAEWTGLSINLHAADVYADGEIDILDATRLMQYIAEWDVELGTC